MTYAKYSVIRYIGDPARGEAMNVGIVLWNDAGHIFQTDDAAMARVVRDNPHLERDALRYLDSYLKHRLAQTVPPLDEEGRLRLIATQGGFPVSLTEPRVAHVENEGGDAMAATLESLMARVVRPRRRGGGGFSVAKAVERELKSLIDRERVIRHYPSAGRTLVPRSVDFYVNSGTNRALDVVNFDLSKADDIRSRADQEAFKIWDLLGGEDVKSYLVLGTFSPSPTLTDVNANALTILQSAGAEVANDVESAVAALDVVDRSLEQLFSAEPHER
jgi:hypothetical protein